MGALNGKIKSNADAISPGYVRLPSPAPRAGKRVLVVDTDEELANTQRLLGGLGFEVLAYDDSVDPTKCCIALVNPTMDEDLRICQSLSRHCKVMLTTNNRDFQFKIEAVRMGAEGLLARPLDAVEVFSSLEDSRKTSVGGARVLLVDDDELTAAVHAMALEECGLRVAVLSNPLQTEAAIQDFRPDLLLMDIDMPGASGLDVARAIRLDPANLSLPILFLSAVRKKAMQQSAREIGGDDFIRKPVDVGYLAKMVRMRAARSVELRQIMVTDGLTGLINHVTFKERLAAECDRSTRKPADFTVALLDLDHFKSINDTYGHQAGDTVIQTFATHLKCSLRTVDVIARYGGEEFAIILLGTGIEMAEKTIDRIRSEFERVQFTQGQETFHVTFSCGLAEWKESRNAEDLLAQSDSALYEAKANGRNCVIRLMAEGHPRARTISDKQ
ncbi:diguanylate cyclase [Rhodobacterales bacterium]|nr:diguanylate cyclase [Rhodobacterales bacterium]